MSIGSNIIDIFKGLFMKKQENKNNIEVINTGLEYFYIEDIARILAIDLPEIQFVQCLYDDGEHVIGTNEINDKDLHDNVDYKGAYYLDEQNLIAISLERVDFDVKDGELHIVAQSPAELLFCFAHELRHVWQKKYHHSEYYKKNAVGLEAINDISEIDADAFAIAYIFSSKTPYTILDLPNQKNELALQGTLDNEQRWNLAAKLSEQYGFGENEKIARAHEECTQTFDWFLEHVKTR